ncbi:hypothetical protein ABT131_27535 [Streptomyces sp900105245]|uniref:hypothetical protein n=1 Tax=Streptomyces sp. 900105245 TaxID=3154379 RepID=UPI003317DC7F
MGETKRRMRFLGFSEQEGPSTPNALAPTSAAAKAVYLMYLEVATDVGDAARELAAADAMRASRTAATYADLGEAAGITPQAARERWPEAVGTHWALYLPSRSLRTQGAHERQHRGRNGFSPDFAASGHGRCDGKAKASSAAAAALGTVA